MSSIIIKQGQPEIHPLLADTLAPFIAKWETAALRVAANHVTPKKFSVPTGALNDSTEAVLAARFNTLSAAKKTAVGKRAELALSAPKTRANLSSTIDIARLDNTTSVDHRLIAQAPRKLAPKDLKAVADEFLAQNALPRRSPRPNPFTWGTLRLDLKRIVCIDETNGFLGTEVGQDEIYLMGTILDDTTNVGSIAPFYVADFDDGTRHDFSPPRKLVSFSLNATTTYPKAYFVSLVLVEKDEGNLNATLKEIVDKLALAAEAWLTAAIVGAIGAPELIAAAVLAAVGAAITWAVGKILGFLISVWEDDLFDPVTLSVIVPDSTATFNRPSTVFHFKGPGEYAVRYEWKLSRPNLPLQPGEAGKVFAAAAPARPQGGIQATKDPRMITR